MASYSHASTTGWGVEMKERVGTPRRVNKKLVCSKCAVKNGFSIQSQKQHPKPKKAKPKKKTNISKPELKKNGERRLRSAAKTRGERPPIFPATTLTGLSARKVRNPPPNPGNLGKKEQLDPAPNRAKASRK